MRRNPPVLGNGNGRRRGPLPGNGNGGKGISNSRTMGAYLLPTSTHRKLTPKEALIINAFLKNPHASKENLALEAGYSPNTAGEIGRQVFRRPHVIAEIKDQMHAFVAKERLSVERLIRYIIALAEVDKREYTNENGSLKNIKQLTKTEAALVTHMKIQETFEDTDKGKKWTGYIKDIRFADPLKPMEMLGKYLKAFNEEINIKSEHTEKHVHQHNININLGLVLEHLTPAEKEIAHKIALVMDNVARGRTTRGMEKGIGTGIREREIRE